MLGQNACMDFAAPQVVGTTPCGRLGGQPASGMSVHLSWVAFALKNESASQETTASREAMEGAEIARSLPFLLCAATTRVARAQEFGVQERSRCRSDSFVRQGAEDYGACPRGFPEPRTLMSLGQPSWLASAALKPGTRFGFTREIRQALSSIPPAGSSRGSGRPG
jgi:hypothetical protein